MTAGRGDWGPVKIRRRGRHTTPSQVEKVAQQAGKAAPAVAIAGALVAAPQVSQALAASAQPVAATALAQAAQGQATQGQATAASAADGAHTATATLDAVQTHAVAVSAAKPARHAAAAQGTYYNVRGGDTLSKIADRFYGNPGDWQFLFHENAKTISNPNLIFAGERLLVPATPSNVSVTSYTPKHATYAPKHAKPAAPPVTHTVSKTVKQTTSHKSGGSTEAQRTSQGMYSCSGLEQIWEQAGGSSAHAFMAAEIAMAESGGNPNAISPTDDFGLWQINASNGALATLNAFQNAKSAITLSNNGTNWGPWTTYHSGAYYGRC